jgi:bla regulator protein blaR1
MTMHIARKLSLTTTLLLLTSSVSAPITAMGTVRMASAHAQILHAPAPLPSYEVATIKPWDGTGYGLPLRNYIASAFGLNPSAVTRLIGPDWINRKSFVIRGKVPDSVQEAMKKMPPEERYKETRLMQQSLLAERFKLKVHFETHELPVFELMPAKGGSNLKEFAPDAQPQSSQWSMGPRGQMNQMRGISVSISMIADMLMLDPEVDGRTVIDKTGLTGKYDVSMKWVPARLAATGAPGVLMQPGAYGPAPAPDTEGPSLTTALQETLGLKLVPSKGPVEVMVIDNIELPTEN